MAIENPIDSRVDRLMVKVFFYYKFHKTIFCPKKIANLDKTIKTFETLIKECDEFSLLLRESLLILPDDPLLNRYVKGTLMQI